MRRKDRRRWGKRGLAGADRYKKLEQSGWRRGEGRVLRPFAGSVAETMRAGARGRAPAGRGEARALSGRGEQKGRGGQGPVKAAGMDRKEG
jgi:hypothetical protein